MKNYQQDFGPFEGHIWLNSAAEGPLPKVSVEALKEAIEWKIKPFHLTNQRFQEVPKKLKGCIARLLNVHSQDVILGNSATYGIQLLANGILFKKGEEILIMQNDFPTNILPWLALKEKGVIVKQIKSQYPVIQPQELFQHFNSATKLVCLSHVHTFSGHKIDIEKIGLECRKRSIYFVVNFSQSLGCRPVDLSLLSVDAVTSAGFKWLCGPYGTGFCWMTSQLRETLQYNQAYWVNRLSQNQLQSSEEILLSPTKEAFQYDLLGTANFFNFVPWAASIDYLLNVGMERIQNHIDILVEKIIEGLDTNQYIFISPREYEKRTALVVFCHRDKSKNLILFEKLKKEKIYIALWKGNLRVAPHIFNTQEDIEKLLHTLNRTLP